MLSRILTPISTLCIALIGVSSCNVFSPLDKPGSDAQYLSAARACFDRGDFACARDNYAKLSSSYSDTATAEESFITLDEQGASMGAYMQFVGDLADKGTGKALTAFANRLTSGAGVSKRIAIWDVYSRAVNGSFKNVDLKNFVTFISSLALTAEILAEGAEGTSQVLYTYITSANCKNAGSCAVAACDPPAGATLTTGAATIDATNRPTATSATSRQLYDAIFASLDAMKKLGASGKFGSAVTDFGAITTLGSDSSALSATGAVDECFRQQLVNLGVGAL